MTLYCSGSSAAGDRRSVGQHLDTLAPSLGCIAVSLRA